jgi:hypothetical protein
MENSFGINMTVPPCGDADAEQLPIATHYISNDEFDLLVLTG